MGSIVVEKDVNGIRGLCVLTPGIHKDSRGYFMEIYSRRDLLREGLDYAFVQDNHSLSQRGVLRGLHFQTRHPQAKLVRVIRGEVFDAAVDLRRDSPTFGQYCGVLLSAENRKQLLIPRGFAHGFLVLSDTAEFIYKCDDYYDPEGEGGVIWNDPDIGIAWPGVSESAGGYTLDGTPLTLSERDQRWPSLARMMQ